MSEFSQTQLSKMTWQELYVIAGDLNVLERLPKQELMELILKHETR